MDTLLIFFAFPLAVIIISAILEKLLRNPIAVAALTFAIFLIVTFAAFDETFLIATLAYTIIALITASIVNYLKRSRKCNRDVYDLLSEIIQNNNDSSNDSDNNNNGGDDNNCSNTVNNLLGNTDTIANYEPYNTYNCGVGRNRYRR